jgi:hypothetical protein
MSPDPLRPTAARSAAEVNADMRALWVDGVLTDEDRYQRLLVEWAEAVRGERGDVVEAA